MPSPTSAPPPRASAPPWTCRCRPAAARTSARVAVDAGRPVSGGSGRAPSHRRGPTYAGVVSEKPNTLGAFLQARRALVTPQAAGIPTVGVRRVPGLRREEVAMLAGISTDYYL